PQQNLSERGLARKQFLRQGFIYDAYVWSTFTIVGGECAAFDEFDLQERKVVFADDRKSCKRPLWKRQNGLTADCIWRPWNKAGHRQSDRNSRCRNVRLTFQLIDDLGEKFSLLRWRLVSC